jgi:hypothetical protein
MCRKNFQADTLYHLVGLACNLRTRVLGHEVLRSKMFPPLNSEHLHAILRVSSSSLTENIQKLARETNFRNTTTEREERV